MKRKIGLLLLLTFTIGAGSETTDQHFNRARELLNARKYKEAAEEFNAVAKLAPDGGEVEQNATYWVGQCYFRMKQYDQALTTFQKIVEDYPESSLTSLTQDMMVRVRREKENENFKARANTAPDNNVIVDPKTGLKFTRILSDERLDLLGSNLGLEISPDGRFLFDLWGHRVIPIKKDEEPFELDTGIYDEAVYGSWSPDMDMFAFAPTWSGSLYVLPVSRKTGQATGPAKKLVEGVIESDVRNRGKYPPRWSPDGKRLVFSWQKDGNFDIWTIPAAGGEPTRITSDPAHERMPAWSPDGKSIVFSRSRAGIQAGKWDVWSIPAEGGTAEKILENALPGYGFSPDGKYLAFYRDGVEGINILRLSDKREFNIAPPEEVVGEFSSGPKAAWSPKDNKLLFYNSGFEYWSTLRLVNAYGGASVELGKGMRLGTWSQGWSPDGKFILVPDYDTHDLWVVPTDGSAPAKLEVKTEQKIQRLTYQPFSPDLKKLAFITEDRTLWIVPISIEEMRVTGSPVKIAEKISGDRVASIGWSPDSKRIAFSSLKGGNADIWIASVDGTGLKQLTDAPESEGVWGASNRSAWSPDGKMVVYAKAKGIWVVPASGGKPREVTKEGDEPVWSPDGKEIAFLFLKRDKSFICFISIAKLANGEIRNLVDLKGLGLVDPNDPSSGCWGTTWSPDGKRLSFFTVGHRTGGFWVAPAEGGRPMELARSDPDKWFQFWSPDGKKLSYNSDRDVRVRMGAIWEVDVDEFFGK